MIIKYHANGLYVKKDGDLYQIGLSDKGQDDVGDVMFCNLAKQEGHLSKGDTIMGVEGAKAVTDFTAPFDGQIVAANQAIEDQPDLLNSSSQEENWILKLEEVKEEDFNQLNDQAWPEEDD